MIQQLLLKIIFCNYEKGCGVQLETAIVWHLQATLFAECTLASVVKTTLQHWTSQMKRRSWNVNYNNNYY